jgi:signal transduction histidine kinase
MEIAPMPGNELARLKALNEYHLPDTYRDAGLDNISRIASVICHAPIALVSIVDNKQEIFLSCTGVEISAVPVHQSIGVHVVAGTVELFTVSDLKNDSRFRDNPLAAQSIGFYAAVPLITPGGMRIGALAVLDNKERALDAAQLQLLQSLAGQVMTLLELRKKVVQLDENKAELARAYADLEKFSIIGSHDLKSPFNNIISITHLLKDNYGSKLDTEGNEFITYLIDSSYQLSELVNGILGYSRAAQLSNDSKDYFNVAELIEAIKCTLVVPANCVISYEQADKVVFASQAVLKQILMNLLSNAIKYNDKAQAKIDISVAEDIAGYTFEVKDNGTGIAPENQQKIFDLFETLHNIKADNHGIGLCVVKRLVEKSGGAIQLISEVSAGSRFIFSIPK